MHVKGIEFTELELVASGKELHDFLQKHRECDAILPFIQFESEYRVAIAKANQCGEVIFTGEVKVSDEDLFLDAVLNNIQYRGGWEPNNSAQEPRQELNLVSTFYNGQELKPEFEKWKELCEQLPNDAGDAGIASVAMVREKLLSVAESEPERLQLKQKAIQEARIALQEEARAFYRKTVGQTELEEV